MKFPVRFHYFKWALRYTNPFTDLYGACPQCFHSILGCLEVEIRRNSSLLTHDHNFGERTNPRASLPMSHVALDAAEVERSLSSFKTRQEDGLDGVELSRVPSLRPRSMCFHVRHISSIHLALIQHLLQKFYLGDHWGGIHSVDFEAVRIRLNSEYGGVRSFGYTFLLEVDGHNGFGTGEPVCWKIDKEIKRDRKESIMSIHIKQVWFAE